MDFLLETAISAFFLAGILAISFLFYWRARSVERQVGMLMKAALTNTRDIRNCSELIRGGFTSLGRADNHQRALLASLNSQMSNLSQMLETGQQPVFRQNAPVQAEPEAVAVADAQDSGEVSMEALERLVAPAIGRSIEQGEAGTEGSQQSRPTGNPVVARQIARSNAAASGAPVGTPVEAAFGKEIPGYSSVSNKRNERGARAGAEEAGLQRKIKTIEELFRKVELPLAGDARFAGAKSDGAKSAGVKSAGGKSAGIKSAGADPANADLAQEAAHPQAQVARLQAARPTRFADLVSMRRRAVNG